MAKKSIDVASETTRLRAMLVNSGKFDFPEADKKISGSRLSIVMSDSAGETIAGQAALLTAVVTAVRCFGRVNVEGNLAMPLLIPLPLTVKTLSNAVSFLGGKCKKDPAARRYVLIGPASKPDVWGVQAFWDRWIAGVGTVGQTVALGGSNNSLAGIAAGALAVGQAFLAEQGNLRAGRTMQKLSLWAPQTELLPEPGPEDFRLPLSLWLIGLGNLGQSYLWSLASLPYPDPEQVLLFLQDTDTVRKENWGTSILVKRGKYGALKTKYAEDWLLKRKFQVRRVDRLLDKYQRKADQEPSIALAGLDKMPARRLLGEPGFDHIIDVGLGATADDYQKVRLNVFDKNYNPAVHFMGVEDQTEQLIDKLMQLPAYQELAQTHQEGSCGAATLAGKSVAVPFVSAVIGALAVTQAIRIASGEVPYMTLAGDLNDTSSIRATTGPQPAPGVIGGVAVPSIED